MYVVMGATGQTGGSVIDYLLAQGVPVRALVRDARSASTLAARGVELVEAEAGDADSLARAFAGADAIYALNPPAYGDADLFKRAAHVHAAIFSAATKAKVGRVVALSSVGAQHPHGTGNIRTTYDLEDQASRYSGAITLLRAANFMENWGWSLAPAKGDGVLPSMFTPLDRKLPMVSARDVGTNAARLMLEQDPPPLVELHGPDDYSPIDAAVALSTLLAKPIHAVAVPKGQRVGIFEAQGMPPATAQGFAEMYDGFNDGLTSFEGVHDTRRGTTTLLQALDALITKTAAGSGSDS